MRKNQHCLSRAAVPLACGSVILSLFATAPAVAQTKERAKESPAKSGANPGDIVIVGERRSAVTNLAPVATLDSGDISAIGATSMSDLLRVIKPLGQSADGEDPIFLLNGQRTSGYQEIAALPPESIDKVEVLPEPAALKFGYPPTRRLLNFITKRQFRQLELRAAVGSTTRPGSTSANANVSLTRLHKDQRFTLALETRHTSSLLQSDRHLLPDPNVLFDSIGNVTGLSSGEIDPALSQAAGEIVTVAPVPTDESQRSTLDAYARNANQPRMFDVGPYRTLVPRNHAFKIQSVLADRLGGTLSGSLDLSAEQSTDERLSGPAAATLIVPAGNPYSPFGSTVLVQRYLTEVAPLRVRQTTTTLHGGGTLRGVTAGWRWDLTGAVDQKLVEGTSEEGIDISPANSAIAAGANPFVPLDASLLGHRLTDHAHLLTRTINTKLVVTNRPVEMPAGEVTVTGTLEAERLSANSVTRGANPFDLSLARSSALAGLALDVPLTSRTNEVLPWAGDLSLNASADARRVGGFGSLNDSTVGINWSPIEGVQLMVQDQRSAAAPAMDKLASPIVQIANAAVFDYVRGRTEIVTLTQGGNPDLAAEHKHVQSIGLNVKPLPGRDLHVSATFQDIDVQNQTGDIYAVTPEVEAIFPDRFVRDSSGDLVSVTFQPTNFYDERQRRLNMTISASGNIGKKGSGSEDKKDDRPHYYAGAGPTFWFADRLQLRPGTPALDLLHCDTVKGWPISRATSYFYGGIGYLGNGLSIDGWYQNAGRIRSDNPSSDLFFSGILKINLGAYVSVHHFLPKQDWAHHVQLRLDVENLADAHQYVHDRSGQVPNRFQRHYLDPLGRTVKVTLRKLI